MSLHATSRSIPGTLRQDVIVDGRFHLATDEPTKVGGDDSAPAPHELLPAAIASCISTTIVMYARTKAWDLGRVVVEVDYDHAAAPRRCEVVIQIERPLSADQRERLEKVAASCPVRRAIEDGIQFHERIQAGRSASRAATSAMAPPMARARSRSNRSLAAGASWGTEPSPSPTEVAF